VKNFLKDEKARIPFSVIGVFLIIGSSVTASYIGSLEQEKSKEISLSLDFNEIEQILNYVEADISRSLSYSGSKALKEVGKNPVISSNLSTNAAKDYADTDKDGTPDLDMSGHKLDDSVIFNINWIKNILRNELNKYIKSNFMDDKCNYLDYIINIVPDNKNEPVSDWRSISYKKINMELQRNCGGVDDYFVSEKDKNYETYWEFSVPLTINVIDTKTEKSRIFDINSKCIVTSRLPIMYRLTNTFCKSINGTGDIFENKLAVFIGLTGTAYTEARALMMWSQGPSKIKNIVDNNWVKYLTNSGLVLEEFMVFNSVDPMSLIKLATKVGDFTGTSEKQALTSSECLSVDFNLEDIENQLKDDIFNELNPDPDNPDYNQSNIEDLLEEAESTIIDNNMIKSVQYIAEEILYDVEYEYYYHRANSNNEPVDLYYNTCDPDHAYTITVSENKYKKKGTSFEDPDNNDYKFILGKADADGQEDVVIRDVKKDKIKQIVKDVIEKKLKNNYNCYVQTDVERRAFEDLGYVDGWSPDYSHGDKRLSKGTWEFYSCQPIEDTIDSSDTLPRETYAETWKVFFTRSDKFEICTDWDGKNHTCNSSKIDYHDYEQEHIVEFQIKPIYSNYTIVDDVFNFKNKVLDNPPHNKYTRNDDNLQVIRELFPGYFVNNIRDNVLQSYSKTSVNDKEYFYSDEHNYKIDWIKAKDGDGDQGSVVEALEEILEMIISDEDVYSNASKEYSGDSTSLDAMDSGKVALLDSFKDKKEEYKRNNLYHINNIPSKKYISIGSKSIYEMREWYLNKIQSKLKEDKKDEYKKHIKDNIGGNSDKYNSYEELQGSKGQDYQNALGDLSSIGSGQGIQIGLAMNLKHKSTNSYDGWGEDIAFAIDTIPNYFEFNKVDGEWDFNVVNNCWGGPTGIPLLPIPPIPWFCTVNFWTIEIEGKYEKFKIVDTLDETHADPLFGHDGQIFIREKNIGIIDEVTGEVIGDNNHLGFDFWTPSFCIVPPNRLPIGDIEGGLREESKK